MAQLRAVHCMGTSHIASAEATAGLAHPAADIVSMNISSPEYAVYQIGVNARRTSRLKPSKASASETRVNSSLGEQSSWAGLLGCQRDKSALAPPYPVEAGTNMVVASLGTIVFVMIVFVLEGDV